MATSKEILKNVFGYDEFRPFQEEIINHFVALIRQYSSDMNSSDLSVQSVDDNLNKPESYMVQQKKLHAKAYTPWSEADDEKLRQLHLVPFYSIKFM